MRLHQTLLFLFVILSVPLAYSSVFTYYPYSVTLSPVKPPLTFLDPGLSNVIVELDSTHTEANVTVVASRTAQIVYNPDLYSSPDYWYCVPGEYTECYWLASDAGASGGVSLIYGFIPLGESDVAYVAQEVTVPWATINSVIVQATFRIELDPGWMTYYVVGLWDVELGDWAWYEVGPPQSSYTTYQWDVTSSVSPGKDYLFMIGVYVDYSFGGYVDFRVDSGYIYVYTSEYTFSNPILDMDVSDQKPYYAKLILDSYSLNPYISLDIFLVNETLDESSHIKVVNGAVQSTETTEIEVSPPTPGYRSAWIRMNLTDSSKALPNPTLRLTVRYCTLPQGEGACVSYPVKVVVDPYTPAPLTFSTSGLSLDVEPPSPDLSRMRPMVVPDA